MKKELAKKYNHLEVEKDRYQWWMKQGLFKADVTSSKPAFSMILPPPNVTGKLHLGHAWDGSIQDALIRFKKLSGYETLYVPAMDHAGIATQTKVEARLREQGQDRFELGREKFLEATWSWKDEYAQIIRSQWAKLGLSLDYDREKFTLDPEINELVNYVFVTLYREGLIYKGKQIVNWDPIQETAISNVEVIYKTVPGKMYYFRYLLEGSQDYLVVATTRPETMFGDQALVVNPQDKRYEKYVGQKAINPVNGAFLPIIADDYVLMDFGTGVMKVTPAHDINDFEIGKRHHLAMPIVLDKSGTVNEFGGQKYQGLDRFVAREKIISETKQSQLLEKIEEIQHEVGFSERSDAVVEPYLSTQWFVKMQPLAQKVLALQAGDDKINFYPERFNEVLETWMNEVHDWTISRQLWWGHQIPVWYHRQTGEVYVDMVPPVDIQNWEQDPDVLDTWFSSGLWPFAALDWKPTGQEQSPWFEKFYPNSVLVTGYDIIFFWVARMVFDALEIVGQKPFDDVLVHGLIRDEQGRKMSKSLGNGIDPMDVIAQYGADSLRFFLLTNSAPGQDVKYSEAKIRDAWNFINKLWNASRYVLMNLGDDFVPWIAFDQELKKVETQLSDVDKWILSELSEVETKVNDFINRYELGIAGRELYQFVWTKFCSWYLELIKVNLRDGNVATQAISRQVMFYVLKEILLLLHPFIPFMTEAVYQELNLKTSIMEETFKSLNFSYETLYLEPLMAIIKTMREFRLTNQLKRDFPLEIKLTGLDSLTTLAVQKNFEKMNRFLNDFVNTKIVGVNEPQDINLTTLAVDNFFVEVTTTLIVDNEAELKKLTDQLNALEQELQRSHKILNNQNFLKKAAPEKVASEQAKMKNYQVQYDLIQQQIANLKK